MKALSIRAPWWWFILHGGKDIENRDWPTRFRGPVWIHASAWWRIGEISDDWDVAARIAGIELAPEQLRDNAILQRNSGGCIVGSVEIVDCVTDSTSPWFFGKYGFVLRKPIVLAHPIPFKGALGFFDVPRNGDGSPRHPLMLPYTTQLEKFN